MVVLSALLALTIAAAFARSRPGPMDWPGFAAEVAALVAYDSRAGRAGATPATTAEAGRPSLGAEAASDSGAPRLRAVPSVDAAEGHDPAAPPDRARRAG